MEPSIHRPPSRPSRRPLLLPPLPPYSHPPPVHSSVPLHPSIRGSHGIPLLAFVKADGSRRSSIHNVLASGALLGLGSSSITSTRSKARKLRPLCFNRRICQPRSQRFIQATIHVTYRPPDELPGEWDGLDRAIESVAVNRYYLHSFF